MENLKALTTVPKATDVATTLRQLADKVESGACVVTRLNLYQNGTLDFELVAHGHVVPAKRIGGGNG